MKKPRTQIDKITEKVWDALTKSFGGEAGAVISESVNFMLTDNEHFIVHVEVSDPYNPYIRVFQAGTRHPTVIPYDLLDNFVLNPVMALKFGAEDNDAVARKALENPSWDKIEHFVDFIRYCDIRFDNSHEFEIKKRIQDRYSSDRRVGMVDYTQSHSGHIRIYFLNDFYRNIEMEIFDHISDITDDLSIDF